MIFLGNGTDDAAGISGRDNVTGNVPRYDGARTDDDVVADGDAGIDDDVTADPDVRADGHGSGIFEVGITHFSIDGVPCRINTDMRRQKDVVAKGNVMFIQDGKTRIGKEVAAKADAVAMVKVDRRQQDHVVRRLVKTRFQGFKGFLIIQIIGGIKPPLRRMDAFKTSIIDAKRVI